MPQADRWQGGIGLPAQERHRSRSSTLTSSPGAVSIASWGGARPAPFVIGESLIAPDDAPSGEYDVLGNDDDVDLFEASVVAAGNGSFPRAGQRDDLTDGQRRQLRDAMIFTAHVRERRHVVVSDDQKAYVKHSKRERLESLGTTKIRTSAGWRTKGRCTSCTPTSRKAG